MRSHTSTSTYSSLSGSESSEPAVRRLMRHSSLETINTNVTSADEFVWVDSHNRLVELQQLPWTHHDVLRVLQNGRTREHMDQVSMETIPRLSYLLQRALVRIGRETQRLSKSLGLCSKHEVYSAFKIVLCPALADSCTKVSNVFIQSYFFVMKRTFSPDFVEMATFLTCNVLRKKIIQNFSENHYSKVLKNNSNYSPMFTKEFLLNFIKNIQKNGWGLKFQTAKLQNGWCFEFEN